MRIIEREIDDTPVLDLHGALRGPEGTALLNGAIRRLAEAGRQTVVVNLENVPAMDAAGLGALVSAYTVMRSHKGTIRLAHLTRRIQDLIVITKLVTVFDTFSTLDDALRPHGPEMSAAFATAPAIAQPA